MRHLFIRRAWQYGLDHNQHSYYFRDSRPERCHPLSLRLQRARDVLVERQLFVDKYKLALGPVGYNAQQIRQGYHYGDYGRHGVVEYLLAVEQQYFLYTL